MKLLLGIFFAIIQAPKKVGIKRAFGVYSDGIFPAPDLGGGWIDTLALQRKHFLLNIFYPRQL